MHGIGLNWMKKRNIAKRSKWKEKKNTHTISTIQIHFLLILFSFNEFINFVFDNVTIGKKFEFELKKKNSAKELTSNGYYNHNGHVNPRRNKKKKTCQPIVIDIETNSICKKINTHMKLYRV